MQTVISRTEKVVSHVVSALSRPACRRLTCVVVTLVSGFVLLSGNFATRKAESRNLVTVRAAGRGKPFFNFADGRQMPLTFRGESNSAKALQSGNGIPRSLTSADLDGNGTPDVVIGYANGGTGVITIQHGNPDAFAPPDDSVFARVQQGYDPDSLLPDAEVYPVQAPADFVVVGNFNHSSVKDILFAAKGGGLYLMTGDGKGGFGAAEQISLPGPVTALAAGEFRAADGFGDVAVGVTGPGGDTLLVFDGADGLSSPLVQYPLTGPATGIEFGGLDDDPFQDIAVAAGNEIDVVHGWGRKESVAPNGRLERINLSSNVRGLALGEFTWDRDGRSELAALTDDGAVQIVQHKKLDTRPFTEQEKATRTRGNMKFAPVRQAVDIESLNSWRPGKAADWTPSSRFSVNVNSASVKPILKTNLSYREMDDVMVMGGANSKVEILRPIGPNDPMPEKTTVMAGAPSADDVAAVSLDVANEPIAAITLPKKINGVQDVVMLGSGEVSETIVPNAPNTTITVDRTDDPSGAGLTAASACTAAANDCSLRGAFQFANLPSNNNTTISLPANTYILSINGTNAGGCDGNTVGDLGANQTVSITGAGAATTIIRQTGTGPANDGDRIMCMNEVFATGLVYNFSGVTFVGGREGTAAGGGAVLGGAGIIGGELNNSLTLTNVVLANNQETVAGSANLGGGGIQITGGNLIITNSTLGGTNVPGLYTDRTSTNTGNVQTGSGGGVTYTPSSPQHTGGTGTLTVTGSTFSHNTSAGIGGGGADLLIFAFAAPGGIGSGSASIGTTTFSNNTAVNGGGIVVESLPTTINSSTNFNNNSASNRGGGIYVGGGSLLLNGAALPAITFSGNTATSAGSSISTAAPVNVDGSNTTIGGDIEISQGGTWTNNAGSTLAPTNVVVAGGVFNMNNSTMNVSGNLTIGPGGTNGGTFNGNTGTVNIQGNFVLNAGGVSPATNLSAGTGTFNFNGTSAQSITNGTSITFFNLTDSNTTQPLTLNNSLAVNGSLNVNGANAILSPAAATVISGTGTLTGTGTARVSRIAATPDFLSQYTLTNKTLTNLTIDYNGAGNQTVNNTPAYSNLVISGSGTKTLQGNTAITGNLTTVAGATFASGNFNFNLGGNWTTGGAFTAGTGTVNFVGTSGIQTLTGNTTFFNLTLNNPGATTNFAATTTTVGNDLVATAGTMDGSTSTIIFTGVTDNLGSISGAAAKNFFNLQINSPATISNTTGANITIENNYSNAGTFSQAAGLTTIFDVDNTNDGAHTLSGAGTSTFGNFTINNLNTVDAGTHSFNVIGSAFTCTGTFTGNANTVNFNGGVAQSITGDGVKNFAGLSINNANGVSLQNGAQAVDASVLGVLTLNTDLTVVAGAILQQAGTSAGAADVLGTVRRTDLSGGVARSFGNLNNSIQINSGVAPTQFDLNLVKVTPPAFPAGVKVVPRDITLTPTGGSGISATVKLRYIDPTELSGPGITESRLILWKNVGGTTWTPQGGAPDTAANFVSLAGVSSFSEWAIAEGSDLTLSKANNVSNAAVTGQTWNWTLTAANTGAPATFTAGQTIITDNLPNSNINYGVPTVQNVSNITGSANISCSIVSNDLTCTANGGSVTFASDIGASNFDVVFSATPQVAGSFANPRGGGGVAQIDPNGLIPESNEGNNAATNTVTVSKANTTTTINSDLPDPSVVGQPVTVTWTVAVSAPGSLGTPLTGNVTVSDGTNQCIAAVSAGQCDVTFTSAGAKSLTATYAGDTNYNGSASSPATAHTVNKADTTTTITSDNPDPSSPGQSVTVNFTVVPNVPGGGTPAGNVVVTVSGGAETCTGTVATGTCNLVLTATGTRTITATYAGDTNFNGSSDTESHDVTSGNIVVGDAKAPEPATGTTPMLFAVTLSAPSPGGITVDYATADQPLGAGHAVGGATCDGTVDYQTASGTVTFAAGEQVKIVSINVCADNTGGEPDETFLLNLTNPVNATIVDNQAIGTITAANAAGTFLISELRTRGSGGAGDDFVELYNNTSSPLTVAASDASAGYGVYKMGTDCNATPVLIGTIPNGTVIPARGHYLMVGSAYSLANYGGTGAAAGNLTMSSDIEDDHNVAVFSTADIVNISSANRLDAAGFGTNTGSVCDLMREGSTLAPVGALNIDYSYFRTETASSGGNPKDTNDNSADFLFADTAMTTIAGITRRLGAPGPENLASPLRRDNLGLLVALLDGTQPSANAPNRFRNFANVIPPNALSGTLDVRRRIQNTTGATVTRLRFRIVELTTGPTVPGGTADLRAMTSTAATINGINDPATCAATGTPTTVPCQVIAQVTTLETPPAQANGGGYNSTLSVNIPGGLLNGQSIDVNFQLGVQQAGSFRFIIIVEALP
jgi:Big-like domain-containing protein